MEGWRKQTKEKKTKWKGKEDWKRKKTENEVNMERKRERKKERKKETKVIEQIDRKKETKYCNNIAKLMKCVCDFSSTWSW